jgi:hypothetical protein
LFTKIKKAITPRNDKLKRMPTPANLKLPGVGGYTPEPDVDNEHDFNFGDDPLET